VFITMRVGSATGLQWLRALPTRRRGAREDEVTRALKEVLEQMPLRYAAVLAIRLRSG